MNYVGQLAETVFGTMKDLYRGLNPATLSGGIDVLVVQQADGSFRCSPFHVRFGKLGVLRSREKVVSAAQPGPLRWALKAQAVTAVPGGDQDLPQVDMEINGEPVDLHMKLGDSGEAFFVQELESDDEHVPPRLCTSPIPCGALSGFPSDSQRSTASEPEALPEEVPSTGRKKKLRRRKPRRKEDTVAANSSSEELETGAESELSLLEKPRPEPPGPPSSVQSEGESSPQAKDIYPYSDGEWGPQASLLPGGLTSPKSDSELELRTPEPSPPRAESHIQWAWGRLPKVAKAEWPESSKVADGSAGAASPLQGKPSTPSASVSGVDPSGPLILPAGTAAGLPPTDGEPPALLGSPLPIPETKETKTPSRREAGLPLPSKSWSWASLEDPVSAGRKGSMKRSQHLGPSDIYLDDLPSLDSENAALYFPRSDCGLGPRRWSAPNSQKHLGDPNPEQEPEPTLDTVDMIELSLCGGLADSRDISLEKFNQHIVSYQDLVQNPGLLEHPNLVVKINEKHYNWAVAAPMILSLQAFQRNLPKSTVDKLEKEKMPRKGGRWWFSWRRRDFPVQERSAQTEKTTAREQQGEKTDVLSSEDDAPESPVILEAPSLPPSPPAYTPTYKKSLRLSSNQIVRRSGPHFAAAGERLDTPGHHQSLPQNPPGRPTDWLKPLAILVHLGLGMLSKALLSGTAAPEATSLRCAR
ncbi:phosphatidate phosphatase LPIN3 isoform X6 [Canis lupus familiaris]|uniref:phosphatidate phosphatase LPIN3 isoform X6 n=1 Tax=Canis lupus dingo TaxID=286419 RepID=UPI000DC69C25|nr:phosphatidate phosphatase LPIN3 isoform X6 [Canis lupus dingo]XP_038289774.1 phosphatidate phosphatase LPIN3 isoform X6 [Canis lupus familiaris]XP_038428258.1 phosphatidate phosphatase LPIN3 isoform X6 [Canis lupus familiaris]